MPEFTDIRYNQQRRKLPERLLLRAPGLSMENTAIWLSQMKDGQQAIVSDVEGGRGLVEKLTAMGIRPGKRVTRFCSMYMHGPVTIRIDNVQLSLGRGIADKILVIPDGLTDEDPSCSGRTA